jgi:CBS domain-containing membrane protein
MTDSNDTPPSAIPPYRRLSRLYARYPARGVWAVFVFFNTFISIAIIALAAMLVDTVFIFPSLGASAFLFFSRPLERFASPRSTVISHAIGIVCGYGALVLFGLSQHPAVSVEGINVMRIFCAGLALATTCALMILLDVGHAPAASTTLIVALGIVTNPLDLIVLEVAVIAITLQGLVINRAEGLKVPL